MSKFNEAISLSQLCVTMTYHFCARMTRNHINWLIIFATFLKTTSCEMTNDYYVVYTSVDMEAVQKSFANVGNEIDFRLDLSFKNHYNTLD